MEPLFVEPGVAYAALKGNVLQYPLAGVIGEVDAVMRVTLLQVVDHSDTLVIVPESSPLAQKLSVEDAEGFSSSHDFIKQLLTRLPEGGMPQVVPQGDGFGEVLVEQEGTGYGAAYLADLDGVGEAGAMVIAVVREVDLGFMLQTAKGEGVDDAVAVVLEFGAVVELPPLFGGWQ